MSAALVEAALRACITLSGAIEATIEMKCDESDVGQTPEGIGEVQSDLIEVFNVLTDQLTIDLKLDARQLVRDLIVTDIEAWRAILRAQGGVL